MTTLKADTKKATQVALARIVTDPSLIASATIRGCVQAHPEPGEAATGPDVSILLGSMREATKSMHAGDMKHAEAMLFNQAMSLEALFHGLADRSVRARPNVGHSEAYLRMALKAQNQCRMTLETLSVLKNPPTVFARQANINNGGQQQVNNSVAAQRLAKGGNARARATQPSTLKTELLEASNGRRLDPGAARAAGRADPKLAPVGKVHRAPQPGGKGPHIAQRL